jgi:hypothetical protein
VIFLVAQWAFPAALIYWGKVVIVVAAVVAIIYVILQAMGVAIPPAVTKCFLVVLLALFGLALLTLLASFL